MRESGMIPDMKLASIQVVTDLRPIPGADRIEAATVLGYQTVVKKGEFRVGGLCVWHEPDTSSPTASNTVPPQAELPAQSRASKAR